MEFAWPSFMLAERKHLEKCVMAGIWVEVSRREKKVEEANQAHEESSLRFFAGSQRRVLNGLQTCQKLLVTSASLVVTSALLVVTRSY